MSEIQEIDVTIDPDGKLTIDIHGAKGPVCLSFTKEIEQLLGGKILERDLNYEYDELPDRQDQSDFQTQGDF